MFVDSLVAYTTDAPSTYVVLGVVPWGIVTVGEKNRFDTWSGGKVQIPKDNHIDEANLPDVGSNVKTFNASAPTFGRIRDSGKWVFAASAAKK